MGKLRHAVCPVAELPPGARKIVEVEGRSIGVFNVDGHYYALRNSCPHQFAPLCQGRVTGTRMPSAVGEYEWGMDGQIIRCPWHGWEFDITTGRSIFNPHCVRVKSYEVEVETIAPEDGDPAVETFPVEVEGDYIILIV